jgi:DNA-binding transcriptional LysR family regulator
VIAISGRAADNGALVRRWTVQGCGIACKSRLDIADDLGRGRLIDLFPEAQCGLASLYAVYPSRQYQPALLQFLQAAFRCRQPESVADAD